MMGEGGTPNLMKIRKKGYFKEMNGTLIEKVGGVRYGGG